MMNIIPYHLIWKSRCIRSANSKRQSSNQKLFSEAAAPLVLHDCPGEKHYVTCRYNKIQDLDVRDLEFPMENDNQ